MKADRRISHTANCNLFQTLIPLNTAQLETASNLLLRAGKVVIYAKLGLITFSTISKQV